MAEFYFAVGSDPRDVFIVIGDNWVHYKRCETEEIARILVDGQNESRRDDNAYKAIHSTRSGLYFGRSIRRRLCLQFQR